jgi:hypothetical protein
MAAIRFAKIMADSPPAITPNTVYLVRSGPGFDLLVSDANGSSLYSINAPIIDPQFAYPLRTNPRIVGDVNCTALTTLALTASRLYFIPLVVPRSVTLVSLGVSVTTAATGTASIGIYNNAIVNGNDAPVALLTSVTGLNTGSTGDKYGSLSYTLQARTLYWACLIASAAATIRALAVGSRGVDLGRVTNNTVAITYLYAAGSGSTLPSVVSSTLTASAGGAAPAIYLTEG